MLIKFWLSMLICFGLIFILPFIFSRVAKISNRKLPAGWGAIGFLLAVGIWIYVGAGLSRLYVVTGDSEWSHYVVIGSPEYERVRGGVVNVDIENGHCMIINETDIRLIAEEIQYGGGVAYGLGLSWIEPGEAELIYAGKMFYFFLDDDPPDDIKGNSETRRWWLRNRR